MADAALVVVDMLNPYEHEDADRPAESATEALAPIRRNMRAQVATAADCRLEDRADRF
ncbi:MAG: hypothetical protein WD993_01760 [Thermoleophilaceae bacterium]